MIEALVFLAFAALIFFLFGRIEDGLPRKKCEICDGRGCKECDWMGVER